MSRRLPCPLRLAARRWPREPALHSPEQTLSFGQLEALVDRAAGSLLGQGVSAGHRVAYLGSQQLATLVLLLALPRLGAVACPLNPRLPRLGLRCALERLAADFFCDAGGGRPTQLQRLRLTPGGGDGDPTPDLAADAPCTQIMTSGSSAAPKVAVLSYANHYYNALGANLNLPLAPGHRWLLALPPFHVAGIAPVYRCLLSGATLALPACDLPLPAAIAASRASHCSLVNAQLHSLLQESGNVTGPLRLLLGGGPVSTRLVSEARQRGWECRVSYGLTEMASQVATSRAGEAPGPAGLTGPPLAYRRIRIAADGEIHVRGETLFLGYLRDAQLQPATGPDGWFRTGDLGRWQGGRLLLKGRRDQMFISGGENICPEEIENALLNIPRVAAAVVVPAPHPRFGQVPAAFVCDAHGGTVAPTVLRSALAQTLPSHMIPALWPPWPADWPMGGPKPSRAQLRSLLAGS